MLDQRAIAILEEKIRRRDARMQQFVEQLRNQEDEILDLMLRLDTVRVLIGECTGHAHIPAEVERCPWCKVRKVLDDDA